MIRPNFSEIKPEDETKTKIAKYHGAFIINSNVISRQQGVFERLKQYCKDLDAGKEITIFESDLSDEWKAEFNSKLSIQDNKKIEKAWGITISPHPMTDGY